MGPFKAYEMYMHIKLHFTSDSYDVRKYAMKRMSMASFERGTIKFKLYRLTQKYNNVQLREFFIANFLSGDKYGGMYGANADEVLLDWQKRIQGLTYHYTQDILHLQERGAQTPEMVWSGDGHPLIAKEYLGKRINLETLVILDKLYNFRPVVDKRLHDDFVWKAVSRTMYKYEPFLVVDKEKFQLATDKVFE